MKRKRVEKVKSHKDEEVHFKLIWMEIKIVNPGHKSYIMLVTILAFIWLLLN